MMDEKVRQFLVTHNKTNGYGTDDNDLIETVKEAKEVFRGNADERRHWTEYTFVVEIDNKFLLYFDARSSGDMSARERGYDFDPAKIQFAEPYTEEVTKYRAI